ncbi:MAG: hypothetical protein Ct9H300mP28_22970 [Pseudomonadota bacterium]|nr:MAG: hypothetical protein Ct9H300mP28_22970 [Pseudomonadota bacterium]
MLEQITQSGICKPDIFPYHGYSILAVDFPDTDVPKVSLLKALKKWQTGFPGSFSVPQVLKRPHLWDIRWDPGCFGKFPARYSENVSSLCLIGSAAKMPVHPVLLDASLKGDLLAFDLVTSWEHGPTGHFGNPPVPGMSLLGGAQSLLNSAPNGALGVDLVHATTITTE